MSSVVTYLSDTPTQTRTKQKVSTPQGTAEGETTITGELVGNLRALKHIFIRTSITVPVVGKLTTDVDIDFVPSLAIGPAEGWCVGATWFTAPSIQTIQARPSVGPPTTITNNLIGSQGVVLAIDEVVTVPAGTFRTVKYRSAVVSGNNVSPAVTWVSKQHNVVVKQDTIDAAGNITSVMELTKLQGQ
ncbi:MAG TPA: hypothetical protein VE010_13840 [Thermoanaerobaculia bacterium]|nr:hypothetical protein [Thermoanaerobaculia bacterium]